MQNQLITEKQDLTFLQWSRIRHSSGTAGSFLKAYSELGGRKTYYKLSNYDNLRGVVGHECVNELIADRLLTHLGIEHLEYRLIHADIRVNERVEETWLCASEDFKQAGEDKIALDAFYEAEHTEGETPLDFCLRMGWGAYLWQTLIVDYLLLNRDRHGANMEVLRNRRKKTLRLAPLFDHGLSLLCSCQSEEAVLRFDVMEDRPIQSYIGSRSAEENLKLIPPGCLPLLNPIQAEDRTEILRGLDGILPQSYLDKIWEMIWKRWCHYEDFCNTR